MEITSSDDEMKEMEEMDWWKSALYWTKAKKGGSASITKSTLYWVHSRKFVDINVGVPVITVALWEIRRYRQNRPTEHEAQINQLNKDGGRKMGVPNACHYQEQYQQQQYWHWRNIRKEECIWKKRVKSHKEEYKETIFQHNRRQWLCNDYAIIMHNIEGNETMIATGVVWLKIRIVCYGNDSRDEGEEEHEEGCKTCIRATKMN